MAQPQPRYKIGDEVLRPVTGGLRRGRVVEVLPGAVGNPVVYQVRVGMVTHLDEEPNLRPALRRKA